MSGYRDETETLRAELGRARAELATLKREPQEIEVIQWREHGALAEWVASSIVMLGCVVIIAGIATFIALGDGHLKVAAAIGALAIACLALMGYIAFRSLPRVKVKR